MQADARNSKRLTNGTGQSRVVDMLFAICAVSYLIVFLVLLFGCFPFYLNWQVSPLPARKCTFKLQNLLATVVLNVVTDALLLLVPIPLLRKLRLPWRQKLGVTLLLSTGLFVIAAALIRAALTLGNAPSAENINRWGVRETIVGLIVVNVPVLRPMFTRAFWRAGGGGGGGIYGSRRARTNEYGSRFGATTIGVGTPGGGGSAGKDAAYDMYVLDEALSRQHARNAGGRRRAGSQECIVATTTVAIHDDDDGEGSIERSGVGAGGGGELAKDMDIVVETTYEVQTVQDEEAGLGGSGLGGRTHTWKTPTGKGGFR